MRDTVSDPAVEALVAGAEAAVRALVGASLDGCTDADVLAIWQRLEAVGRSFAVADHGVIGQVETRHLPHAYGARDAASLARNVLRITAGEARARVENAAAAGSRHSLTGGALAPIHPCVAQAQAEGEISPQHAQVITRCIAALPDHVQHDGAQVESFLVDQARIFDPSTLTKVTTRLLETVAPDGSEPTSDYRNRRRGLELRVRDDGSALLEAELTAEAAEHLRTALDTLARPRPNTESGKDTRSAAQRRHDGLLDMLKLVERSGLLPDAGGVTTTVILSANADDWAAATGLATTGHGVLIATAEAKRWTDGESCTIGVVLDRARRIEAYTDTSRTFTPRQRLALILRDGGCSFPGCDAPPTYCESHHVEEHCRGGPTHTDNGCLLCGFHHREFERMGWRVVMTGGVPYWIPPRWIDPAQVPRRNHLHRPELSLV